MYGAVPNFFFLFVPAAKVLERQEQGKYSRIGNLGRAKEKQSITRQVETSGMELEEVG